MENAFPGGQEIIRKAFLRRNAPQATTDTLLASLTDATIKQYTKPLRDWWTFGKKHEIDIFSPTPESALKFLGEQLQNTKSYSSLNNIRSAISLISDNEIGKNSLVKRFCTGVSKLYPPKAKYDFVWDPDPVIQKLKTIFPYENFSLEKISKKLAVLLALATGHRLQTLSLIKLSGITIRDKMIIKG